MMTTTLAVDGNNLLMRSVKAAEGRVHLSVEHDGQEVNTGPVLLFINLLSKYVRQVRPDRLIVCFDGGRSRYRTAIFDGYKAARGERDGKGDDTTSFALAKEFLSLSGLHHIEMEGVEADDLIAGYWLHRRGKFVILSGDKDFLQLVGENTVQLRPGTGDDDVWTKARVEEKMGCVPRHLPLVMALTGDAGDGVPGIPGFGTKTAVKFLSKYHWDLDALLDAEEKKLDGHQDEVLRNLALVDLRTPIADVDVPPAPRFSPTGPSSVVYADLRDWFARYQMESVQHRLITDTLWR